MDPYENLANAIVIRAADDYRMTENPKELKEIEAFFLSGWFTALTKTDGGSILKMLREEKAT